MPECQKFLKRGLDQYGAECFGRLVFATIRKSVGLKRLIEADQGMQLHVIVLVIFTFLC